MRVLHVDDEELDLKFTKILLEKIDPKIRVECVNDPVKAMELLRNDSYDIVLSDFKMGAISGIQFAEKVRKYKNVPIILYTGYGSEEIAEKAFKAGINDYIKKEIDTIHYNHLAGRLRKIALMYKAEEQANNIIKNNIQVIPSQKKKKKY